MIRRCYVYEACCRSMQPQTELAPSCSTMSARPAAHAYNLRCSLHSLVVGYLLGLLQMHATSD